MSKITFFRIAASALLFAVMTYAESDAARAVRNPLDVPAMSSPLAANARLVGLTQVEAGVLAAVGERGHIVLSNDAGVSWNQAKVPVSSSLNAIHFSTDKIGWAVGHEGVVLKSEDGGASWQVNLSGRNYGDQMVAFYAKALAAGDSSVEIALDEARRFQKEGPDKPFLDVWFENEKSGWVIGAFNLILKTDDGGESWQPWMHRTDNEMAKSFYMIDEIDGEVYIAGELGLLLRLDREQQRFVALEIPYPGTFFGITGGEDVLVAYGLKGSAFLSRDKGISWEELNTGVSGGVTGGVYLGDGRLVMVSTAGDVVISRDGGTIFENLPYQNVMALSSVGQAADGSLVLLGAEGTRVVPLR